MGGGGSGVTPAISLLIWSILEAPCGEISSLDFYRNEEMELWVTS